MPIAVLLKDVRDDAKLAFAGDEATQRAFGMGSDLDASSSSSIEAAAHDLLNAAELNPAAAKKLHLDPKALHHLEDLLHALDGADVAHVKTKRARHDAHTATDSLAHVVSAQVAHIRLAAKWAFRGDEVKLGHYASTLPRHEVKPRSKHAPAATPGS